MKNILLLLFLIFVSCQKEDIYSIEIYGTDTCFYTQSLVKECAKLNLNYTYFSDSDAENSKKETELVLKYSLGKVGNFGPLSISYISPIVKVIYNDKITCLERPNIEDVKKLINK